jgi:hypothetical protein
MAVTCPFRTDATLERLKAFANKDAGMDPWVDE